MYTILGIFTKRISRGFTNDKAPLRGFYKRAILTPGSLQSPGAPTGVKSYFIAAGVTGCLPVRYPQRFNLAHSGVMILLSLAFGVMIFFCPLCFG